MQRRSRNEGARRIFAELLAGQSPKPPNAIVGRAASAAYAPESSLRAACSNSPNAVRGCNRAFGVPGGEVTDGRAVAAGKMGTASGLAGPAPGIGKSDGAWGVAGRLPASARSRQATTWAGFSARNFSF